jgi:hypothetical protein
VLQAARWTPAKFVEEWSTHMRELATRAAKPRDAASWHVATARRLSEKGAHDAAREQLELALQYDDGGHEAAMALADHGTAD